MTRLGMKRRIAFFLVNRVFSGTRCFAIKRGLLIFAGYPIGDHTQIVGPIFCTGNLSIGSRCWIGRDLRIHGNGSVVIGDNCDLGPEVAFLTGSHAIGPAARRAGPGKSDAIRVEPGCWICARTTVTNAVTIGRGSVVAACACVVTDVPENTLVGGVPARILRTLHEEEN